MRSGDETVNDTSDSSMRFCIEQGFLDDADTSFGVRITGIGQTCSVFDRAGNLRG